MEYKMHSIAEADCCSTLVHAKDPNDVWIFGDDYGGIYKKYDQDANFIKVDDQIIENSISAIAINSIGYFYFKCSLDLKIIIVYREHVCYCVRKYCEFEKFSECITRIRRYDIQRISSNNSPRI
jgi:hypothetical protein